jgi:hypothetical protein
MGEPIDLAPFGLDGGGASISPDEKILFFRKNDGDLYWVSAILIEDPRSGVRK